MKSFGYWLFGIFKGEFQKHCGVMHNVHRVLLEFNTDQSCRLRFKKQQYV